MNHGHEIDVYNNLVNSDEKRFAKIKIDRRKQWLLDESFFGTVSYENGRFKHFFD